MKLFVFIIAVYCFSCKNSEVQFQEDKMERSAKNVFGQPLVACCTDPMTGYYRDGHCYTGPTDYGTHIVCARMTDPFLQYSKAQGNDLITPLPTRHFPGLVAGDYWCLCISRWIEANRAGVAPPIKLEATHENALQYMSLEVLKTYSIQTQN